MLTLLQPDPRTLLFLLHLLLYILNVSQLRLQIAAYPVVGFDIVEYISKCLETCKD